MSQIKVGQLCSESDKSGGGQCRDEPAVEGVRQTVTDGVTICGKIAAPKSSAATPADEYLTYLTIDRPRDTDAEICRTDPALCYDDAIRSGDKCPLEDQRVCPGFQGLDNQVCVDSQEECPVTDIRFVPIWKERALVTGRKPPAQWTALAFTEYLSLGFSRETDSRPLTEFKMDFQPYPCMN